MLDCTALHTAIVAAAATGLLAGKLALDHVPADDALPFGRFSDVADSTAGSYGHGSVDSVTLQFSVFSYEAAQAATLAGQIATAVAGRTLTSGSKTFDGIRRSPVTLRVEQPDAKVKRAIYHARLTVEFYAR